MARKKKKKSSIIRFFIYLSFILILLGLYSYYIEPSIFTFKEYNIKTEKITDNFVDFKIIHISDIHYGNNFDKKRLKKLVSSINKQKPDIVVLTGDLIDKSAHMTIDMSNEITNELKKIDTVAGKYSIKGNHDLKFDEWSNIMSESAFIDLTNTYDTIYKNGYNALLIAGASSFSDKESINDKLKNTLDYINSFEKDGPIYKILLMHEPDYIDDLTDNKFDLILAGHSHGGLIKTPFKPVLLPNGAKKYYKNHYKIQNSDLYISNGLGNNEYNFRFLNTPSYNIYKFSKP